MENVHNNTDVVNQLNDLLRDFSIETQKRYEQVYGLIESGKKNELLEERPYEEIVSTGKFESAYSELVDKCCIDLSTRMQAYLEDLAKKMIEYNNVTI